MNISEGVCGCRNEGSNEGLCASCRVVSIIKSARDADRANGWTNGRTDRKTDGRVGDTFKVHLENQSFSALASR